MPYRTLTWGYFVLKGFWPCQWDWKDYRSKNASLYLWGYELFSGQVRHQISAWGWDFSVLSTCNITVNPGLSCLYVSLISLYLLIYFRPFRQLLSWLHGFMEIFSLNSLIYLAELTYELIHSFKNLNIFCTKPWVHFFLLCFRDVCVLLLVFNHC